MKRGKIYKRIVAMLLMVAMILPQAVTSSKDVEAETDLSISAEFGGDGNKILTVNITGSEEGRTGETAIGDIRVTNIIARAAGKSLSLNTGSSIDPLTDNRNVEFTLDGEKLRQGTDVEIVMSALRCEQMKDPETGEPLFVAGEPVTDWVSIQASDLPTVTVKVPNNTFTIGKDDIEATVDKSNNLTIALGDAVKDYAYLSDYASKVSVSVGTAEAKYKDRDLGDVTSLTVNADQYADAGASFPQGTELNIDFDNEATKRITVTANELYNWKNGDVIASISDTNEVSVVLKDTAPTTDVSKFADKYKVTYGDKSVEKLITETADLSDWFLKKDDSVTISFTKNGSAIAQADDAKVDRSNLKIKNDNYYKITISSADISLSVDSASGSKIKKDNDKYYVLKNAGEITYTIAVSGKIFDSIYFNGDNLVGSAGLAKTAGGYKSTVDHSVTLNGDATITATLKDFSDYIQVGGDVNVYPTINYSLNMNNWSSIPGYIKDKWTLTPTVSGALANYVTVNLESTFVLNRKSSVEGDPEITTADNGKKFSIKFTLVDKSEATNTIDIKTINATAVVDDIFKLIEKIEFADKNGNPITPDIAKDAGYVNGVQYFFREQVKVTVTLKEKDDQDRNVRDNYKFYLYNGESQVWLNNGVFDFVVHKGDSQDVSVAVSGMTSDESSRFGFMSFIVDGAAPVIDTTSGVTCVNYDVNGTQITDQQLTTDAGKKEISFTVVDNSETKNSGVKKVFFAGTEGETINIIPDDKVEFNSTTGACKVTLDVESNARDYYIVMVDNVGNISSYKLAKVGAITKATTGIEFVDDKDQPIAEKSGTLYLNGDAYIKVTASGLGFVLDSCVFNDGTKDYTFAINWTDTASDVGTISEKHVYRVKLADIESGNTDFVDGKWTVNVTIKGTNNAKLTASGNFTYDNTAPELKPVTITDSVGNSLPLTQGSGAGKNYYTATYGSYEKHVNFSGLTDDNINNVSYQIVPEGNSVKPDPNGWVPITEDLAGYSIDVLNAGGSVNYDALSNAVYVRLVDNADNETIYRFYPGPIIVQPTISTFAANQEYMTSGKKLNSKHVVTVNNLQKDAVGKFYLSTLDGSKSTEITVVPSSSTEEDKTDDQKYEKSYTKKYVLTIPSVWSDGTSIAAEDVIGGTKVRVEFRSYDGNDSETALEKDGTKKKKNDPTNTLKADDIEGKNYSVIVDNSTPEITFGKALLDAIADATDPHQKGFIYNEVAWGAEITATMDSLATVESTVEIVNGGDSDELKAAFDYDSKSVSDTHKWIAGSNKVTTGNFKVAEEGKYSVTLVATNKAGTEGSPVIVEFTYDKTKPSYSGLKITGTKYNYKDYQFIDNKSIGVSVTVQDAVSGIKKVVVYQNNVVIPSETEDGEYASVNGKNTNSTKTVKFAFDPTYKGTISLDVTDGANNTSHITFDKDTVKKWGVIAEKDTKESSLTLTTKPIQSQVFNGVEYYNGKNNLSVAIRSQDTISGINNIVLMNTMSGQPTANKTIKYTGNAKIFTGTASDSLDITRDGEYVILATMTDNAGNKITYKTGKLIRDARVPVITSNVASATQEYQNRDVSITVSIDEKYHNNAATVTKIYNNGVLERTINGSFDSANRLTIPFSSDGKYYFTVETTDKAGNHAEYDSRKDVSYREFTVDKTQPKLNISFNNNSVQNGKYYRESRTGNLTVTEHNFDPSKVIILVNGSSHGVSWSNNGDVHTASIPFNEEKDYTLNITATDLAGNHEDHVITDEFTVDLTDPDIQITGVEADQVYSDSVAPQITITDTNYSAEGSVLKLLSSRIEAGGASKQYETSSVANGQQFAYVNFEVKEENDDYYVLSVNATDLSGRTSMKEVAFKVDRFGSYFQLGSYAKRIAEQVYTNLDGSDELTIEEYNLSEVDAKDRKVYFVVGDNTVDLKENDGYTVTKSENAAHYNVYTYVFDKSKFADDGEYRIVVSTTDKQGKSADNEVKDAALKFVIDRSTPEFTISNIENGKEYEVDKLTAVFDLHDNVGLANAKITVDGEEKNYTAKELADLNYQISLDFESGSHTVSVSVTDQAGNKKEDTVNFSLYKNAAEKAIKENPWLLWVGIGLGVLLILGIIIVVVRKRRQG